MEKFKNKYRIPSTRLQNWDYGWDAAYFITICTQNRNHYFGEIVETGHALSLQFPSPSPHMQLSHIGVIADILWHEIKNHANNIELGAFQVMPNHLHGILILNGNNAVQTGHALSQPPPLSPTPPSSESQSPPPPLSPPPSVETGHALSLPLPPQSPSPQPPKTIGQQRFQHIGKNSIFSLIGSYKSAVTKHTNRLGFEFEWQTRFHDHIIRNNDEFQRIQQYIINNPAKWADDKFYNE